MEDKKKKKSSKTEDQIDEVFGMFKTSLALIQKKIIELEKNIKEEEDKEKIAKIKNKIKMITD